MDRGRHVIISRAIREFDPEARLYCSIAAAVIGGSALSAGASIWGSSKAADAQTQAAQQSIAAQKEMYGQNKNLLQPFITAGQQGLPNLQNWVDPTNGSNPLSQLIKLTTPGADMSATLEQTPGYQFSQKQGTRAALNALAARGLGGSPGAIAKGVSNYNSGLASTTWDSVVKNLLSTFGMGTNALQGLVNTGVQSGSALAGVGTNTANQISGALTGAGNAQAAGYNAMGSAAGGFGNSLGTAAMLQQLTGGGGGGSIYGNPSFGGNGVWGGSSQNPLSGLDASDYGAGY
jgi:hypothetical protein